MAIAIVLAPTVVADGGAAPLLFFDPVTDGSAAWSLEGDGSMAIIQAGPQRMLRVASGETPALAMVALPAGTDRVVMDFYLGNAASRTRILELRDADEQTIVFLEAQGGGLYASNGSGPRTRLDTISTTSHRLSVELLEEAYVVDFDGLVTAELATSTSQPPATLVVSPAAGRDILLDLVRAHGAGTLIEHGFSHGLSAPGFQTYGDRLSASPNWDGFRDVGYLVVNGSTVLGEVAMLAWPQADLGARHVVQVAFRAPDIFNAPDHTSILAAVPGESGLAHPLWAITVAPVPPEQQGPFLSPRLGVHVVGQDLLPQRLGSFSFGDVLWHVLHARIDAGNGTAALWIDDVAVSTITGLDLTHSSRYAVGDVWDGPAIGGERLTPSGLGRFQFDAIWAAADASSP